MTLLIDGRNATLNEAQDWLRLRLEDGEKCPCCTQFAKVYRRRINAGMAAALIKQYRLIGLDYGHTTKLAADLTHEAAQLAWWDMLLPDPARRDDGGRSGWWRISEYGKAFLHGRVAAAKYARIFDGKLLALDYTDTVTITDCLGSRFDYRDLMAGR